MMLQQFLNFSQIEFIEKGYFCIFSESRRYDPQSALVIKCDPELSRISIDLRHSIFSDACGISIRYFDMISLIIGLTNLFFTLSYASLITKFLC